jgi:flagellar basal body rod protein FlgB
MASGSTVSELKSGLDRSTQSVRQIAHRVANASSDSVTDFASALEEAQNGGKVDLEKEMVSLAEEQIRYEATSKLLSKVYQQIRRSIREG